MLWLDLISLHRTKKQENYTVHENTVRLPPLYMYTYLNAYVTYLPNLMSNLLSVSGCVAILLSLSQAKQTDWKSCLRHFFL